jgi:hypothetical protein
MTDTLSSSNVRNVFSLDTFFNRQVYFFYFFNFSKFFNFLLLQQRHFSLNFLFCSLALHTTFVAPIYTLIDTYCHVSLCSIFPPKVVFLHNDEHISAFPLFHLFSRSATKLQISSLCCHKKNMFSKE